MLFGKSLFFCSTVTPFFLIIGKQIKLNYVPSLRYFIFRHQSVDRYR